MRRHHMENRLRGGGPIRDGCAALLSGTRTGNMAGSGRPPGTKAPRCAPSSLWDCALLPRLHRADSLKDGFRHLHLRVLAARPYHFGGFRIVFAARLCRGGVKCAKIALPPCDLAMIRREMEPLPRLGEVLRPRPCRLACMMPRLVSRLGVYCESAARRNQADGHPVILRYMPSPDSYMAPRLFSALRSNPWSAARRYHFMASL